MTSLLIWRRTPVMEDGRPGWFRPDGMNVRIKDNGRYPLCVVLCSDVMHMDIVRSSDPKDEYYAVGWVIHQPAGKTRGRIVMTRAELAAAFGLSLDPGVGGEELVMLYGGDSSVPGRFHRWNLFLNIPCPGTGCVGDPNVSIYLTEPIKSAVNVLLGGLL